jgi:Cof subfamily protein (haloacid dehalogenase superfamily)
MKPPVKEPAAAAQAPIKLVAIDLDGTLLDDSKKVSEQTVEALCGLPERGVRVVIASARPPRSVRHIYRQLRLDTWQVNYNGALIWDEAQAKAVFHRPLSRNLAWRIIDDARDMFDEVLVSCEILDRWYTDRAEEPFTTETGKLFRPDVVAPLETFAHGPVTKLLLLGDPRMTLRLEQRIDEQFGQKVSVVRTDDHLLQIMDKRVSKATALQIVARHYGLTLEEVMAIGDAPNDVAMLQIAGVSVAMDNAHALVKAIADWIAPSNNDHGVCAALRRYGLAE